MNVLKKLSLLVLTVLLASATALAQSRTVKGVVRDTNGEPIMGAGVFVKGASTQGTVTDLDGNYSISGVANGAVLIARSIGYKEVEVNSGNLSVVDITMESDAELLEETVVVGYGSQRKLTLTGSVATTTGTALVKNSSVNLSQGLAGRLSGVIVNNPRPWRRILPPHR